MQENVLISMIQKKLIKSIEIQKNVSQKGKPAKREADVWIVSLLFNNGSEDVLESARGGPREWVSLDRLHNWLSDRGIKKYLIKGN